MLAVAPPLRSALQERRYPRDVLRARFDATIGAPLPAALPLDGQGLLAVVDTNSVMSQSGGVLVINGTPAANDGLVTPGQVSPAPGRALLVDIPARTTIGGGNSPQIGWSTVGLSSADTAYGADYSSTTAIRIKAATTAIDTVTLGAGRHCLALVQANGGGLLLARVGASGPYTLLWVYPGRLSAAFAKLRLPANAANFQVDDWRVVDLGPPFDSQYGLALARLPVTAAGGVMDAGAADALIEWSFVAAAGEVYELSLRRTTDADRWIVRMDQAGGTARLIEVVGGVETQRDSQAQTFTVGTSYRVVARTDVQSIRSFVNNVIKPTWASAASNQSATGLKVSHVGTNLCAWPLTVSLPSGA